MRSLESKAMGQLPASSWKQHYSHSRNAVVRFKPRLGGSLGTTPDLHPWWARATPHTPPSPRDDGKCWETQTWLHFTWAEKNGTASEGSCFCHPHLSSSSRIADSHYSPQRPPPVEKTHPYFSFFVLKSPVIWFPKYRRGRGNVWKIARGGTHGVREWRHSGPGGRGPQDHPMELFPPCDGDVATRTRPSPSALELLHGHRCQVAASCCQTEPVVDKSLGQRPLPG